MRTFKISILFLFITLVVKAEVKMPQIFSNHMVLQRNEVITVYGWANPKEKVSVSFNNYTTNTKANRNGEWSVKIPAQKAGGPYELSIKGNNTITFRDVMVGEVWICSGQSNMEWILANTDNAEEEIAQANYSNIRHIKVPKSASYVPLNDINETQWEVCSPSTAGNFTAVGYYFAKRLASDLDTVCIGLINTSWGGTVSEAWTSIDALANTEGYEDAVKPLLSNKNVDYYAAHKEAILNDLQKFQSDLSSNDLSNWKESDYDDSNWSNIKVPQAWSDIQGLSGFDGDVWYRYTINLSKMQIAEDIQLKLPPIDDADYTYVNGVEVANKFGPSDIRNYVIPHDLLKVGENTIAIRIIDTGGNGGIIGSSNDAKLVLSSGEEVSISGTWKARIDTSSLSSNIDPNSFPALLYNAMIVPLLKTKFKGAIWYQGESNSNRAKLYQTAFKSMINDWRDSWEQGDFPFYFVQLSSYNNDGLNGLDGSKWAELREAQTMALELPNTGMAVITDVGNPFDIHPRNKKTVGYRLADNVLVNVYKHGSVGSGPMFKSINIENNKAIINFSDIGSGLEVRNKYKYITGFQIAGSDKKFHWAQAYIDGDSVVVYNSEVDTPVAVRYCWTDLTEEGVLYNKEGYPASPFRTDTWKGLTDDTKYIIK